METEDHNSTRDARLAWVVTALSGWYVAWTGYVFARRIFEGLFAGLGAEVPWPTRVVIKLGTPLTIWSVTSVVLVILVLKEFRLWSIRTRVIISVALFMMTACMASLTTEALFRPMFTLLEQVK